MGEQCKGCPWLDEQKKQCRRSAPRFCLMDKFDRAEPAPELAGVGAGPGESRAQPVACP
jgi:hypothetical protein